MQKDDLVIIDYGAGNLRSVARAVESLHVSPTVTNDPAAIAKARAIILPGVGAAADTMNSLSALGLVEPIKRAVAEGKPFFGVCLGLQVLLDGSEEGGWQECLGLINGVVIRFNGGQFGKSLKVPHMGWNQVRQASPHPLFKGIPDGANFYFVHSYYARPALDSLTIGLTSYGIDFPSVIARDNVVATQFHPEKSGDNGLKLYSNFLRWAGLTAAE